MPKKYDIRNYDFKLVFLLIIISIVGILAIGSAKESVQSRQIFGVIIGVLAMLSISFIDYNIILKFQWPIYGINIFFLVLVQIFGESSHNAQRWVELMGIRFQPSELAKILLILFYAQFIMFHKEKLNSFVNLAKAAIFLVPPWILIYKQPDMSTSIMIIIIFAIMLYVGGLSYKIVLGAIAVVVPVIVVALFVILQSDSEIIEDYQRNRINAWLHPDEYELTTAFQTKNSITAIGSGQLTGKGYKNNEVGSVKNGKYISEPQTDFIFAIIGEELGFVGCMFVIILETLISFECFYLARKAPDTGGTVICSGVGAIICFQSFINISVTTGILPNTGLPLPFVSYGLTSLVSLFIGMGFVLNVGLQRVRPRGF